MIAKPSKPLTAKERTVAMPGIDMRESPAPPSPDMGGPPLWRLAACAWPFGTHYVVAEEREAVDEALRAHAALEPEERMAHGPAKLVVDTICRARVRVDPRDKPSAKVCQACRAEASRLRGVVR